MPRYLRPRRSTAPVPVETKARREVSKGRPRKSTATLDFDFVERNVDEYLSGTVNDIKTLKNTVVSAVDNYFRVVVFPSKPWVTDSNQIEKVDRIRRKIIELATMFSHRLTVQSAVVNGFRLVLNSFCSGRMELTDREWPFVKVLLMRFVSDIDDDNLLCALGKMLSTQMAQTLGQGCRSELSSADVQLVVEITAFIKSLSARIGRNSEERKNEKRHGDSRGSSVTSFVDDNESINPELDKTPPLEDE